MELTDLTKRYGDLGDLERADDVSSDRPAPVVDQGALAAELGGEIAGPLTSALARVTALSTTGRIDRSGLLALRREIEAARRAGMIAQQLGRLARGRIRQSPELISLSNVVREALAQRAREIHGRQIELRQVLQPAQVMADGSFLFTLMQALLDWSVDQARGRLEYRVEVRQWPLRAHLTCRLGHQTKDADALPRADTMAWRLVEQASHSMGLVLQRTDTADETRVSIEFPRTVNEMIEGVSAVELDDGFGHSINSKPLAGSHVLVVASRREVRTLIRDAVRSMGLMLDFTTSVDEAREFCRSSLPHAIVYESGLGGERFQALRRELLAEVPSVAFIAIGEDGNDHESSVRDGQTTTRIGREAIQAALPSALLFELSRGIEA